MLNYVFVSLWLYLIMNVVVIYRTATSSTVLRDYANANITHVVSTGTDDEQG